MLIRSACTGGCRGSGPSPSTLPVVSTLQAVSWRGLWTALKLCHLCCGLLAINKSNSVSSETPRAQFTIDWCLVARSSFINCIKTTAWALLSLEVRKSRPIRNVAGVGFSGGWQGWGGPTPSPAPRGFSWCAKDWFLCYCLSFTGDINPALFPSTHLPSFAKSEVS